VKRALRLLDSRNKFKFFLMTSAQMALGLLDLIFIVLLGLFGYVGSAYLGISNLSQNVKSLLRNFLLMPDNLGKTLICLILIAVILIILKSTLAILILKRIFLFLAQENVKISSQIGHRFLNSPFELIASRSSQEATYAIGRGLHLSEILGNASVLISEMTMIVLLFGLILISNPTLGLTIALYFVAIYLFSQKKLGGWVRANSQLYSESNLKGDEIFQEGIGLYKELFVANKLNYVVKSFSAKRLLSANATANIQLISYIPKFTFESALIIGACIIGFLSFVIGGAESGLNSIIVFFAAGSRILPSLLRLQSASNAVQSFSGASEIAFDLINDIHANINEGESPLKLSTVANKDFEASVSMTNVDFDYTVKGSFSLKDISFNVPEGSSMAIVGRTGGGKSTLVNLLLGILQQSRGDISVSGVDPKSAIRIWPGSVGYVPQDVVFLNGSVRENVAIAVDPIDINDKQIWNCLKLVHLDSLFSSSKHGLDSLIGERGLKLSGGQRQRIGIARALYSNPKLLVLDEATSALDAETEKVISETIRNLGQKVTLIVVAHRISTVQNADQVIYVEDGRIRSIGSFAEVRHAVPDFEHQANLMGL
jgi:ABC-type bacteriocin/lantibiotic exporter with double-glycine peptidase domain